MRNGGKTYLSRFSKSERAVHWIHAAAFFVLLGSGLVLYLPSLAGIGNRGVVKDVHLYTAIAWALALAPNVLVIPGVSSVEHLRENLRASEVLLDKNAMQLLSAL